MDRGVVDVEVWVEIELVDSLVNVVNSDVVSVFLDVPCVFLVVEDVVVSCVALVVENMVVDDCSLVVLELTP